MMNHIHLSSTFINHNNTYIVRYVDDIGTTEISILVGRNNIYFTAKHNNKSVNVNSRNKDSIIKLLLDEFRHMDNINITLGLDNKIPETMRIVQYISHHSMKPLLSRFILNYDDTQINNVRLNKNIYISTKDNVILYTDKLYHKYTNEDSKYILDAKALKLHHNDIYFKYHKNHIIVNGNYKTIHDFMKLNFMGLYIYNDKECNYPLLEFIKTQI